MEPNLAGCKTIKVRASEVARAIERGKVTSDDWQAQLIEIALIPSVYRRWRKVNRDYYPEGEILRHEGRAYKGFTREDNERRGRAKAWREIAGYTFRYRPGGMLTWNSVKDDYYGHSASTCWDGLRRETLCSFVENLRTACGLVAEGKPLDRIEDRLAYYRIEFVDDTGEEA